MVGAKDAGGPRSLALCGKDLARAEGALWHNWSPPLMVLHYAAKDQTPANATVAYVLGE